MTKNTLYKSKAQIVTGAVGRDAFLSDLSIVFFVQIVPERDVLDSLDVPDDLDGK